MQDSVRRRPLRPSSPTPSNCWLCCVGPKRARRWRSRRCGRWRARACTTRSVAASTATRPTGNGACPHFEKMLVDNALLGNPAPRGPAGRARGVRRAWRTHARLAVARAGAVRRRLRRESRRRQRRPRGASTPGRSPSSSVSSATTRARQRRGSASTARHPRGALPQVLVQRLPGGEPGTASEDAACCERLRRARTRAGGRRARRAGRPGRQRGRRRGRSRSATPCSATSATALRRAAAPTSCCANCASTAGCGEPSSAARRATPRASTTMGPWRRPAGPVRDRPRSPLAAGSAHDPRPGRAALRRRRRRVPLHRRRCRGAGRPQQERARRVAAVRHGPVCGGPAAARAAARRRGAMRVASRRSAPTWRCCSSIQRRHRRW